jgi:hypothetical protein
LSKHFALRLLGNLSPITSISSEEKIVVEGRNPLQPRLFIKGVKRREAPSLKLLRLLFNNQFPFPKIGRCILGMKGIQVEDSSRDRVTKNKKGGEVNKPSTAT